MGAWEDGFAAGYRKGIEDARRDIGRDLGSTPETSMTRPPRRGKRAPSAYSKRYGKAFKRLAPKYKKKSGGWKKNGFKRCSAAARRAAKK